MNSRGRMSLLVMAVLTAASVAAQSVVYVDADAPPVGTGASWAEACRYLQDGLMIADANVQIRVADGVYWPDHSDHGYVMAGDREASFEIADGISLLGGYAGRNAPDPNACDPDLFVTLLCGDLTGDDDPNS